jgi:membrane protein implicated in regulation of membrane protease activity
LHCGRNSAIISGKALVTIENIGYEGYLFFTGAGAPVMIGIALAAIISWLLHRAFILPFVLAGVSATLLEETRGWDPDPALCEKFASLFTP